LPDGIFGLAVSPPWFTDRFLYFHSLAAGTENAVSLRVINTASNWATIPNNLPKSFNVIGSRGIQTAGENFHSYLKLIDFTILQIS
jgi:hypothetical protein